MKVIKVLICGSRHWSDWHLIKSVLETLEPESTVIIHGAAKGADTLAAILAVEMGFYQVKAYPTQWSKYGRAAGPIRNQQMLDEEDPEIVHAFSDDLYSSKGAKDMVRRAKKHGCSVTVWSHGHAVLNEGSCGVEGAPTA
jgi:hypothetical protein